MKVNLDAETCEKLDGMTEVSRVIEKSNEVYHIMTSRFGNENASLVPRSGDQGTLIRRAGDQSRKRFKGAR